MRDCLLGIFGGTFDPVHCGHLRMATELLACLPFAEIRFIPCQQPVLKDPACAQAKHRLAMLELALQEIPRLCADPRELQRNTPSYMVETLTSLRQEYPQDPLCLIIGMDAFLGLCKWYKYQQLIALAHFVVINRAHYHLPDNGYISTLLARHQIADKTQLLNKPAGHILLQHLSPVNISSSHIRLQIAQGKDVEDQLPPAVWQYIQEQQLYM